MKGLCAGFGSPIGAADLALIKSLGFSGVRQDVPSATAASALVREFQGWPPTPIFLVGGGQPGGLQQEPSEVLAVCRAVASLLRAYQIKGAYIEIGNELDVVDGYASDSGKFAALLGAAHKAIREDIWAEIGVISGGITNPSRAAVGWLGMALASAPADLSVGFHSYRDSPDQAKDGYRSRAEEFAALWEVAAGRPLICTEFGWHTASVERGFPLCWTKRPGLSDAQVADYAARELALQEQAGIAGSVWYQFQDGPTDDAKNRYGIRRMDGSLKPVAEVFA